MNHYLPEGGEECVCGCTLGVIHKEQAACFTGKRRRECSSCNYIPVMVVFDDGRRPFREHPNVISRQQNEIFYFCWCS